MRHGRGRKNPEEEEDNDPYNNKNGGVMKVRGKPPVTDWSHVSTAASYAVLIPALF